MEEHKEVLLTDYWDEDDLKDAREQEKSIVSLAILPNVPQDMSDTRELVVARFSLSAEELRAITNAVTGIIIGRASTNHDEPA